MTAPSSSYIAFRDVRVEYPGHVPGLNGVSLQIAKGEFVFFVGKTGAGKSTLIKLLTHEVRPTSGLVMLNGKDVGSLRTGEVAGLRRGMGIVPQDFALLPSKKVWENVAYAMRAVGHSRREVRRRVPDILEQVNIAHRADAFPNALSGGERQRVAIARALINNPPLLIADEPTGNLDPDHSWEIMEVLRGLNVKGTTVLVASHDMMVIHRMGKRIVTVDHGRVIEDSPATNVIWTGISLEQTPETPAKPLAIEPISASTPLPMPKAEPRIEEIKPSSGPLEGVEDEPNSEVSDARPD